MNNASDASGIARELRPCSVFEKIVFCCFDKAPSGAIDLSRRRKHTVHVRFPIVLRPIGAIHLTSFRLPSGAPRRAPLIYFWLFEKYFVPLQLKSTTAHHGHTAGKQQGRTKTA